MREIKFRAYIKATNKIEEVISINFDTKTIITKNIHCYEFKDVILMQYTELKDKNVKEIYEGDILEYANKYRFIVCFGEYNINPKHCAESIIIGFYLKSIEQKTIEDLHSINGIASKFPKHCAESEKGIENLKLQIVGNIYDNPELLEEGE